MDEHISLRPTTTTMRLGPSTDFFAAFRTGAGKHLRARNREAQWDDKPSKRPEERIRYSRAYLLKLKEEFKELPVTANPQIACFVNAQAQSESWTKTEASTEAAPVEEVAETTETKWRNKGTTPTDDLKAALNGIAEAPTPPMPQEENPKVMHLQKAEEVGREAYRPRAAQEITNDEKAVRQVNGTLNKLTPDNFDRLVQQIVGFVKSAEVLRKSISLVFEKGVAEPTFCALYADLCERLSKQIPDFPPLEGEMQRMTFRRVLLNTCQDEFEGVEHSRAQLQSIDDPIEREAAEKTVKGRTLGNMRLISELFNKGLVAERIMHSCLKDLLDTPSDGQLPHEDNLEAVCEVLTLAGKKMAQGQMAQSHVPVYMSRLEKFSKTRGIASRIVFLIRDVMDMQRNGWVPRREKFTAKKIEEIHAEAVTELGVQIKLPQIRQQTVKLDVVEEVELFPMPKGMTSGSEWKAVAERLSRGPAAARDAPPPSAEEPTTEKKKDYKTEEDRTKASVSMFKEFLSSADKKEAVLCAEEICGTESTHAKDLIQTGIQELFDCVSARDHEQLTELLVWFVTKGIIRSEDFVEGLEAIAVQLDDLVLDIPKAPELCGGVLGSAIADGQCAMSTLPSLCRSIMSAETRRPLALAVFKAVQSNGQDPGQLCRDADLHAKSFLQADASYDLPDLESVEQFLERTHFANIPL